MRSAILQLPEARTANERRKVLRTAIRQLERADLYLAAVAYMDLGDREAQRALNQVRGDLAKLGRYLGERRNLDTD
jgi:acyl-CoA reductase-like NAD-dependent aldehyde dehydrogenase